MVGEALRTIASEEEKICCFSSDSWHIYRGFSATMFEGQTISTGFACKERNVAEMAQLSQAWDEDFCQLCLFESLKHNNQEKEE